MGLVRLMGRHAGFIAMEATNSSRDVDVCLIPEFPFGNLFILFFRFVRQIWSTLIYLSTIKKKRTFSYCCC
jgi:6-phosphofructokinase